MNKRQKNKRPKMILRNMAKAMGHTGSRRKDFIDLISVDEFMDLKVPFNKLVFYEIKGFGEVTRCIVADNGARTRWKKCSLPFLASVLRWWVNNNLGSWEDASEGEKKERLAFADKIEGIRKDS